MQAFKTFTGIIAPFNRSNIDTDAIIPKQFLKSIKRTGFGANLFDEWRYHDQGELLNNNVQRQLKTDFILNNAPYDQSEILLARENFGLLIEKCPGLKLQKGTFGYYHMALYRGSVLIIYIRGGGSEWQ